MSVTPTIILHSTKGGKEIIKYDSTDTMNQMDNEIDLTHSQFPKGASLMYIPSQHYQEYMA
jgi:hypothetical protein